MLYVVVAGSDRSEQQWLGRQRRRGARQHAALEAHAEPNRLQRLAIHVTGCRWVQYHLSKEWSSLMRCHLQCEAWRWASKKMCRYSYIRSTRIISCTISYFCAKSLWTCSANLVGLREMLSILHDFWLYHYGKVKSLSGSSRFEFLFWGYWIRPVTGE